MKLKNKIVLSDWDRFKYDILFKSSFNTEYNLKEDLFSFYYPCSSTYYVHPSYQRHSQ